jgi:squalene cyclase
LSALRREEFLEFTIKLRDAAALILDGANAVLEALAPPEARQSAAYDLTKIKWEAALGTKGPYEKTDGDNTPDYQALLKDLQTHKGKMNIDGSFYWLFDNQKTIGRKPRGKQ